MLVEIEHQLYRSHLQYRYKITSLHLSHNLDGHRGTLDDLMTISLHFVLSYLQLPSELLHNSILSIPSHYLSISSFVSHVFLFHQLFSGVIVLGETRWAGDMPIPSQLPFLYWSEKFFIRANQCPDTTVDLFICDVVFVSDV